MTTSSHPLESHVYHSEKAFKDYWRKLRIWKYFNHMISFFVFIYVLEKVASNWSVLKDERAHLIRIGISTIILMVLPFIDTVQFRQLTLTATACVLIISIINLEQVYQRHQSFVSLYFIMIFHRLLQFRTFYDNFALCISFSADVSSLGHGEARWYITSNLFLWSYFWIVWYFQNAYKRNSFRIWEHLQVLQVFKEKQEIEIKRRREIVESHFHPDLMRHLFPTNEEEPDRSECESAGGVRAFPRYVMNNDVGCSIDSKVSSESGKPNKGRSPFLQYPFDGMECPEKEKQGEVETEPVFLFAKKEGLLSSYEEKSTYFDQLQYLNGLDRRNASLIAVKIEKGEAEECAFVVDREQNLHQMMDNLAQKYEITSIRRFGNVWIGVSGFFRDPKRRKLAKDDSRPHSNTSTVLTGEQRENGLLLDRANSKVKIAADNQPQQYDLKEEEKADFIVDDLDLRQKFDRSEEGEKESMSVSMDGKELGDSKDDQRVTMASKGRKKYPDPNNPFLQQLPFTQTKGKEKSVKDADAFVDCLRSIQFCSELRMILLQCGFRMTAAIDYGNILGGFVKSPHFDLFGQEVRWILKTVELQEYGVIMVSDQVKEQFHTKSTKEEVFPEFQRADSEYPWKKDSYAKITVLTNGEKLVSKESVGDVLMKKYQVQSLEELPEVLLNSSWFATFGEASYSNSTDRKSSYGNASRGSMMPITATRKNQKKGTHSRVSGSLHQDDSTDSESAGRKDGGGVGSGSGESDGGSGGENKLNSSDRYENWWSELWLGYIHFMYWYEDLGTEFKLSIKERWNVDFHDAILQKYSEKELNQMVIESESKMYDLLGKVCFPDLYHLFFLHSTYQKDMQRIEDQNLRENLRSFPYLDADLAYNTDIPFFSAPYSNWTSFFANLLRSFSLLFSRSTRKVMVIPTISDENELDNLISPQQSKMKSIPPLEPQDTLRSISSSSEVSSTRFYDAFYRPWTVYIQDARLFCHINPLNLILEILIFCGVWFAIVPLLFINDYTWTEAIFLNIFFLYCIISRQLDKQYERIGNYVLIGCMALLFILFPCYLLREIRESQYHRYGDWGGDVSLMLIFALRIPNCMRQTPWVSFFEGLFIRILLAIVRYGGNNCNLDFSAMFTTIVICVALLSYYSLLQYRCYLSYLLEHHLLYYSAQKYEEEKLKTSNLFIYFHPQLADLGALYTSSQRNSGQLNVNHSNYHHHFHFRQIYQNTAVAAVHLKVADIGSTILEPRDFLKLLALLQENIHQIFNDFGVLRLTNFSGMFMAVVNKSHNNDGSDGVMKRGNVNHNLQVLYLLKRLQRSMERFSIDHNFNVSMGVSVSSGNVYLGFLGNRQACFDASGVARDVSMIMASHSSENGMYIAREFESLLPSIIPNTENHVTRHFTSDDHKYGFYWLKFDGTVSGIQLQDFTYIGMLGKGGYGSVHLVTEKYTNINLAVKVIVLKNSVMSRMIKRECIILQKMQHPNIVKFLYSFLSNNRLYLVMKYVTGGNLKQVIERDRPTLLQLRIWFAELISAVEYIHNVGILHRDIKPANCMISDQGYLQLADFGLSKSIKRHPLPEMPSPGRNATVNASWSMEVSNMNSGPSVVESQTGSFPGTAGDKKKKLIEKEKEKGGRLLVNGRSAGLGRLDVSNEMREKLASFFPLKSHLAGGEGKATTVKALVVNSAQAGKEESKQVHAHFTIGVCRANRVDAEMILTSMNVDIVFIEFNHDDNMVEVCEMIKDIRVTSRNTTPVYVLTVYYQANSREFIECGAEECFEKDFNHLDEEVLARIFNIASYDYQKNSSYQMENSNRHKPVRTQATESGVELALDVPEAIGSSGNGAVRAIAERQAGRKGDGLSVAEPLLTPVRSSSPVYLAGMAEKVGNDRNANMNAAVKPVTLNGNFSEEARMQQQGMVGGVLGGGGGVSDSDEKEHIVGTIHFIAPEILRSHYYSVCSDWWACGITFYYCIVRKHLFSGEDRSTIFHNILHQEIDLSALDEHERSGSGGVKDLVGGLLQKDIRFRYGQYGTDVLIKHPFFKGIRWENLPEEGVHRLNPKHFAVKKFNLADKATFYGDANPMPGGSSTGSILMGNTANNNNNLGIGSNAMGNGVGGVAGVVGTGEASLSSSTTSLVNGGTGVSSASYYNREMLRKISYNKMKMDLRNDYLLNRFKTLKSRLRDYRKRRMQHYSIKHEKKQRLEKGNGFRNDENGRMSSYRASLELDGLDNDPSFYELEQMSSFASSGYYSSRQNAQLQYISQQQMMSESLSPSEHSDSSFYSDKTIQEEENEDEEEDESSRVFSGGAGGGLGDEEEKEELDHMGRLLGQSIVGGEDERGRTNGYYGSSSHEKGARHRYDRATSGSQNNSTGSNSNNTSDSQGGKSGSDGESRKANRSRKNSLKRSGRSLSGGISRSSNDRSETSSGSGSNSNTGERGGSGSQSKSRSRSKAERLSRQSSGKNSVAKVREFGEDWNNEGEGYEYGGDDEYDGLDYLEEMKNRSMFEVKGGEEEEEEKLYLEEIEKSLEKEEIENDKSMSIPI